MTKASRLVAFFQIILFFCLSSSCQEKKCEDIKDPDKCMKRSGCRLYPLYSFTRAEGGRFECSLRYPATEICQDYHDFPVPTPLVCTQFKGNEYLVRSYYQFFLEVYACEGHENQYGDCVNEDVCAHCGNGIHEKCEFCDGELGYTLPCNYFDPTFTGGMVTRCNATCDDYDFSDCTTD